MKNVLVSLTVLVVISSVSHAKGNLFDSTNYECVSKTSFRVERDILVNKLENLVESRNAINVATASIEELALKSDLNDDISSVIDEMSSLTINSLRSIENGCL